MTPLLKQLAMLAAGSLICFTAGAQGNADPVRPAVLPLEAEPAPRIIAHPPIAEALARGVVIIQFRTENMRVKPIFGKAAVEVSPRLGHLHVTIDDWQGTWAHTSEDPIIVVGLKPGTHTLLLELADPNHKILARETVSVTVPEKKASMSPEHKH
ncbi:DUF6130 family protein [Noviherbaspirillum aerium]|uniref:DUF6130 family protein n=1 Tax=Noviherbaspirillum aerium TaxID=2588497 RepID=UPI00124F5E02|nr:DUF6130 family protein [Noviherbaspirillum aerium]